MAETAGFHNPASGKDKGKGLCAVDKPASTGQVPQAAPDGQKMMVIV